MYEQGRGALPFSKKNQQLIDVFRSRGNLAGCTLMNVMKMKTKMTVSVHGSKSFCLIAGERYVTDSSHD